MMWGPELGKSENSFDEISLLVDALFSHYGEILFSLILSKHKISAYSCLLSYFFSSLPSFPTLFGKLFLSFPMKVEILMKSNEILKTLSIKKDFVRY